MIKQTNDCSLRVLLMIVLLTSVVTDVFPEPKLDLGRNASKLTEYLHFISLKVLPRPIIVDRLLFVTCKRSRGDYDRNHGAMQRTISWMEKMLDVEWVPRNWTLLVITLGGSWHQTIRWIPHVNLPTLPIPGKSISNLSTRGKTYHIPET